jgi:predicted kinase
LRPIQAPRFGRVYASLTLRLSVRVENHMKRTVHLINGRIGSGKTTFARKLEAKFAAARFTHNEWMAKLYGQNPPEEHYRQYYGRVESLIWDTALATINAGADVILDLGFWSRESRDAARRQVTAANAVSIFYSLSCPHSIARSRTLERSKKPPMDSLRIDSAAYDKLDAQFEPMEDDEEFVVIQGTDD